MHNAMDSGRGNIPKITLADSQVDEFFQQIQEALNELSGVGLSDVGDQRSGERRKPPVKQKRAIEEASGQSIESFVDKLREALRDDICRENGVIFTNWKKFREIEERKQFLQAISSGLIGMGIGAGNVTPLLVPVAVYIIHIGLTAFCKGGDS